MEKKFIVRLSDSERETLKEVTKRLSGSSQKVRRANILLMADADGPNWPDKQIAEAFSCQQQTVQKVRNLVEPIVPSRSTDLCNVECAKDLRRSSNGGTLYDRSDADSGPSLSQSARLLEDGFVFVKQHATTGSY